MKQTIGPHEEKRSYHSQIRQQQAEETHQRILTSARQLLVTRGYIGMTLEAVAQLAGVSPKTVSAVIGSKREILAALINPDTFDAPIQQLLERLRASQQPLQRVKLVVEISRKVYESLSSELELLRTAGVVALELAELARQVETRRRHRQTYLISDLHAQRILRSGLSIEEATDILWSLTSYDLYRMLVIERHWSAELYETWLTNLLIQQLLQPD